jgi:hypothetical protein
MQCPGRDPGAELSRMAWRTWNVRGDDSALPHATHDRRLLAYPYPEVCPFSQPAQARAFYFGKRTRYPHTCRGRTIGTMRRADGTSGARRVHPRVNMQSSALLRARNGRTTVTTFGDSWLDSSRLVRRESAWRSFQLRKMRGILGTAIRYLRSTTSESSIIDLAEH